MVHFDDPKKQSRLKLKKGATTAPPTHAGAVTVPPAAAVQQLLAPVAAPAAPVAVQPTAEFVAVAAASMDVGQDASDLLVADID
jgi:hypothetical protein